MHPDTYSKKRGKKRPTFKVLIHEDISFIEHTVDFSLLDKTIIVQQSAECYYTAVYFNLCAFSSQNI